jgi:glucose/arabinose dehydrogenase
MNKLLATVAIILFGLTVGCAGDDGVGGDDLLPPGDVTVTTSSAFPDLSFNNPIAMVQAPGDASRWFVVEQEGIVRVFTNSTNVASSDVFINISDRVVSGGERGLLGIAFHPDFAGNGQVFLSYTNDDSGLKSRVSRFTSTDAGQTLDPGSEFILLSVDQPQSNHNGGQIGFGPEPNQYLFIAFGDGGGANDQHGSPGHGQDTETLLGAMLRIDVDGGSPYGIPADNPFATNVNCNGGCAEIYAWGLRNPWRWSFDRETNDLWVGDVGQNAWEEIDILTLGGNYGWRVREGAHCNDFYDTNCASEGFIDPVTNYGLEGSQSVTGGYVYRGTAITDLIGSYVYGDFISGDLFQYHDDGEGRVTEAKLLETNYSISSFAEDLDGELYLLDYGGGKIYKIIDVPQ